MTTDFNQPDPTTYKSNSEKEISPPVSLQKNDYAKPPYPLRATYVKAPQVPSNFTKLNPNGMSKLCLSNLSNSSLGIPYMQSIDFSSNFNNNSNKLLQGKSQYSQISFDVPNANLFNNNQNITTSKSFPSSTLYSTLSSSNLALDNVRKFGTVSGKVAPPPFPIVDIDAIPDNLDNWTNYTSPQNSQNIHQTLSSSSGHSSETTSPSSNNKKSHAKVKFSDTVTAFIVPEIKRPQRPPPPPSHVTDPQRELANSLPLCHPNEDYLKDFTPVRKDDLDDDGENQQPKIKVVHFGVV